MAGLIIHWQKLPHGLGALLTADQHRKAWGPAARLGRRRVENGAWATVSREKPLSLPHVSFWP